MLKPIIASLLLTSLVASPAAASIAVIKAPAPVAAPADKTVKSADASAQKICRWVERSGTHAKQKFCLTKEQWQQVEDDRG